MKVWIVEGMTGEYGDHYEWPVAAFLHEATARESAEKWNKWLEERHVLMTGRRNTVREGTADYDVRQALRPPFDPAFRCDYTGSEYVVWSVELQATPEDVADWSVAAKASAA